MKRFTIITIFILVNLTLLFLLVNPWITQWQGQAIGVMAIEVVLLLIIGIPATLYQMIKKKKTFKQSVTDSFDAVLDFLSGFA